MFNLKRGDTSAGLRYTLLPSPISLAGATVVFSMRLRGLTVPKIARAAAVIEDAANGVVRYDWQAGDTDTPGLYEAEFEVTYADGAVETFPNSDWIIIRIEGDIA